MSHKALQLSAVAALVLSASSVMAATPVSLNSGSGAFLRSQFSQSTGQSASINSNRLAVVSESKDSKQVYHQRLQQMYDDVPVIGGYAIIHSKQAQGLSAQKSSANGTVYQNLMSDLGVKPLNKSSKALAQLESEHSPASLSEKKSALVVYVDDNHKAHWAYQVSMLVQEDKSMPKRPSAFIDAKTFKPLQQWDDIKTITHQSFGLGAGGNERVGEYAYTGSTGDYPLLEITRDDDSSACFMETKLVKVIDMDSDYSSNNKAMKFECAQPYGENTYKTGYEADGYDKVNGAYSPSNDAMFVGYVIHHMYKEWYNVDALTNRDGSTMQVVMRVHYGNAYENAFWDGKQMTYGDGDTMMHPLVSMGVGAHEISHGFTQQHSNLSYYAQSGGMNESFSDMAAMAAIYYSYDEKKAPSFMIGDMIMKESSGYKALRYMDKPSRDGRSIDTAKKYSDGLDVHYSSGVFNRMFYLMATTTGWNTRQAFDVMVKANSDYWTPYENFQSGACGILKATADYQYPMADVEAAIREVGLDPEKCSA